MRPANCNRIHFSMNGTIGLHVHIPEGMAAVGDTATALSRFGESNVPHVWRCVSATPLVWQQWDDDEKPWTHEWVSELVGQADVLGVVDEDGTVRFVRNTEKSS